MPDGVASGKAAKRLQVAIMNRDCQAALDVGKYKSIK